MHIGGLRTALYTWLYAKKAGGKFILRIEDTDQERLVEGATELIYKSLRQAGLTYDEGPDVGGDFGPYIQTERRNLYKEYAWELVRRGGAYVCFCTKERLDALRAECEKNGTTFKYDGHCSTLSEEEVQARIAAGEPYVIRQKMPTEGTDVYDDVVFGRISIDYATLDDTVLLKSDGLPTYNFANVVDDHLMGITDVIRGEEYLSSTPKYNALYDSFGWERPRYIHVPPVMKDQKRKLSKRYGDPSFEDLLQQGYLKDAIVNYIALLGWNPGNDQEMFTLEELIDAFDTKGLSKSPSIFDLAKLRWFNAAYIRKLSAEEWKEILVPELAKTLDVEKIDVDVLCRVLQPRVEVLSEVGEMVDYIAAMPEDYDLEIYAHKKMKTSVEQAREMVPQILEVYEALDVWTEESLLDCLKALVEKLGVKNGQVYWPARIAITGRASTAGGATEIAAILGKEETLRRIRASIEKLNA
ncbi:MAG: glutamate--tRNA ligase [Clostridia bacterium]|nr:glutamate--tRNA ligase [Clostridia bacterium]